MRTMNTRALTVTAMLIAIEIVLSRFFSISTPIVKIGLGFMPIAIAAMLYGPIYAGVAGAAADFIGAVLFPIGAYFPGFTFTAFLTGAVYGIFLHNRPNSLPRIAASAVIILALLDLGLNTFWIQMITGNSYFVLLSTRIIKAAVMLPVQILLIKLFAEAVLMRLPGRA